VQKRDPGRPVFTEEPEHRDRLIEQAKELEHKYKDPATPEPDKERINSYLNLREQHADHFRELVRANDTDIRDADIIDTLNCYGKEPTKHFHFEMAFQSLATTDRADYDAFNSQPNAIAERISNTSDAKEREILRTTKFIEAYDHVAQTAIRISTHRKQITDRSDKR